MVLRRHFAPLACALLCVAYTPDFALGQEEKLDPLWDPAGAAGFTGTYTMPNTNKYDYADALHKALMFYHAQRSGQVDEHRLAWRTHSCTDCKGKFGEDLSGGWYEAANTMKWTQPMAFTVTQLAFNIYNYGDEMKSINEKKEALKIVRWGAEYLINAHPEPNVLVAGFGLSELNGTDIDFGYFGPPEEYDEWAPMKLKREAFYVDKENPSSEMAGQAAAALAATSVIWKDKDPEFAKKCLEHAKQLFSFGNEFRGTFKPISPGLENTVKWYPSSGFLDELGSAAIWLYIATEDATHLQFAKSLAENSSPSEYSWDDVDAANLVLLYKLTGEELYAEKLNTFFSGFLPGGKTKQTSKGLSFYMFWGSLRYASNHAFLALVHADTLEEKKGPGAEFIKPLRNFAVQQINYMLGDCGRSWVVGFGDKYPKSPYHKGSYNSFIDYPMRGKPQTEVGDNFLNSPEGNRFILYGALVGGPANDDSFLDDRSNYQYTEVTQDYNAAFVGSLAGLVSMYSKMGVTFTPGSDCNLDLGWNHPNAKQELKPSWPKGDCYHTCEPCSDDIVNLTGNPAADTLNAKTGQSNLSTSTTSAAADVRQLTVLSTVIASVLVLAGSSF